MWDMKWNYEREPISCETHCCYHSFVPHKYIHTVTDIHTHMLEVTWRDQLVGLLLSFDGLPDDDDQDDEDQRQHHAQHAHPLTGLPLHTTNNHVWLHRWQEIKNLNSSKLNPFLGEYFQLYSHPTLVFWWVSVCVNISGFDMHTNHFICWKMKYEKYTYQQTITLMFLIVLWIIDLLMHRIVSCSCKCV